MGTRSLKPFKIGNAHYLDECAIWPKKAVHFFDRIQAVAILAALEISRPLLVKGEPGCGKTQLARAAAQVLGMPLASLMVNERTESEDLLYNYDALQRLSDANSQQNGVAEDEKYLSAGPLWWALDHSTAKNCEGRHSARPYMGDNDSPRDFANGVLLLIDEIDKADRAVPNSLLDALGNYSFNVPWLKKRVTNGGQPKPLIIITSNQEQELPPAFIRRCLVLDLSIEDKTIEDKEERKAHFIQTLSGRGRALLGKKLAGKIGGENKQQDVYELVAEMLWDKRQNSVKQGLRHRPGQAEYFDHLEALWSMTNIEPENSLEEAIHELATLTYDKF